MSTTTTLRLTADERTALDALASVRLELTRLTAAVMSLHEPRP